MDMVHSDDVQEVFARRQPRWDDSEISLISNSPVSGFVEGVHTKGKRVEVDFDRRDNPSGFPWQDVEDVLVEDETAYDLPVNSLVIRFEDDEFEQMWRDKIDDAIDSQNFPLDWIEPPFFAELTSTEPGDPDTKQQVEDAHPDRYFMPRSNTVNGEDGLALRPRTLDVVEVHSFKGWSGSTDPQFEAWSERQNDEWTPKKLENRLMNFFDEDVKYAGMMHNTQLVSKFNSVVSNEYLSRKTFDWVEGEEWEQQ